MLLVSNLYLLSLMKCDGFNSERLLRLKFHCLKCESNETLKSLCHSCLCWYGFDLYTIERTRPKGDQRNNYEEINYEDFSFEKEKEVFKPKSDIIDSIKKSFDINNYNKRWNRMHRKETENKNWKLICFNWF